jgi:predicted GIY-YIG superfamily endonuclease
LFDALKNLANFYTGLNIMEDNTDTEPVNENQSTMNRKTSQTSERTSNGNKSDNTRWIRLNHKGIYHDNRRLLKHRAKNCECFVCYREIYKLPPAETNEEYLSSLKAKMKEREIKKSKRLAKKDVKAGKQATIEGYFRVG